VEKPCEDDTRCIGSYKFFSGNALEGKEKNQVCAPRESEGGGQRKTLTPKEQSTQERKAELDSKGKETCQKKKMRCDTMPNGLVHKGKWLMQD